VLAKFVISRANELTLATTAQLGKGWALEQTVSEPCAGGKSIGARYLKKKGAAAESVMFMLFNAIVVPVVLVVLIVGSNVMVNDPITGSTGTEKPGVKE
jgi:hypothetical protein